MSCSLAGGFKEQLDRLSDEQRLEVLTFLGGVLKSELDRSKAEAAEAVAAAKEEAKAGSSPARGGSMLDQLSAWGSMTFKLPGSETPSSPPLGRGAAALERVDRAAMKAVAPKKAAKGKGA